RACSQRARRPSGLASRPSRLATSATSDSGGAPVAAQSRRLSSQSRFIAAINSCADGTSMIDRPNSSAASQETSVEVLIIGAGFSGIGMGIQLQKAGIGPFLIIEKSSDIGGTWWENRYPGCACDIPSHLYSFSFEPSSDWTRMYPGRQEIHDYLKKCIERHNLRPHIRLNARFEEAKWDESASLWRVAPGG